MAKLTLSFEDIYKRISEFLGLESSPSGDVLTKVKDITYRGLRQFLYPVDLRTGQLHVWSFVKQLCTLNIQSGKYKYSLPTDFSDFLTAPQFDDADGYNELTKIGPEQILSLRTIGISSGFPTYFALAPFTYDNQTGTMYELWLDPEPDGPYTLKFFYRIDPLKPENTTDLLMGGIRATEALLETCLAVAEKQEDEAAAIHTQESARLIQELIRTDIQDTSDFLGNLSTPKLSQYRWGSMVDVDNVYSTEGGVG